MEIVPRCLVWSLTLPICFVASKFMKQGGSTDTLISVKEFKVAIRVHDLSVKQGVVEHLFE